MDHKPEKPEAISADPMKKGSSSQIRSSGCACNLAAITIVVTVIVCTDEKLERQMSIEA